MSEPKKPDLFVDDDWKAQAQSEKEKLAEKVESTPPPDADLPPASFETLMSDVALQAMMHLGMLRDETTGKGTPVNLPLAKYHIDTLIVLRDKTKGNVDEQEAGVLGRTLQQLQLAYVQATGVKK